MFLNGALYTGEGKAGEIGHTIIHDEGHTQEEDASCEWCGSKGCLEALAGWGSIVKAARPKRGARYATSDDFAEVVLQARSQPHSDAGAALRAAAQQVARVLGPLIHVLNPQVVVIGGDVGREAYDIVGLALRSHLKMYTMRPALADVSVVASRFDHDTASLRGAAALLIRPELVRPMPPTGSQRLKPGPLLTLLRRTADQRAALRGADLIAVPDATDD